MVVVDSNHRPLGYEPSALDPCANDHALTEAPELRAATRWPLRHSEDCALKVGAAGLYIGDGGTARTVVVTGLVLPPDSNLEIACHPSDL